MDLKTYLALPENTQEALAAKLNPPATQGAVSQWLKAGRVPSERVLQVEAATDGQVTRHEMRPDLYPEEKAA
jgi:DNA-binding transcriptional regulator YdaS (Cro superfamily)